MKPNYVHDCDKCTFLGSAVVDGKVVDLYHCAYEPTIIARWSSEGGDYSSGNCFGEGSLIRHINGDTRGNKGLMIAYVMAMANGLDVSDRFGVNKGVTLKEKIANFKDLS